MWVLLFQVCLTMKEYKILHTHTHTHTFNGPFSGTTRVSQYQKGKTNLDFTEARDSEWRWHQLGHMQVCTVLQTDTTPAPHRSVFYRPDALPAAQPTASKHWRHGIQNITIYQISIVQVKKNSSKIALTKCFCQLSMCVIRNIKFSANF